MKTPEFYLDEVAEEVVSAYCMTLIKEAMRRYAEDACKEQRDICHENAKIIVGNLLETKPSNKYFFNMKGNLFIEVEKEQDQYFTQRISQVLGMWDNDPEFKSELEKAINIRIEKSKRMAIINAKNKLAKAAKKLEKLLLDESLT